MAGVITFTSATGNTVKVTTPVTGSFNARLAVGSYEVIGTSPQYNGGGPCTVPAPVVVTAGQQVTVDVVCIRR